MVTPTVEVPFTGDQKKELPYSRSPLPAMFGVVTQVAAPQNAFFAQPESSAQLVAQVAVDPATQTNPLQLCDPFAMQELAPPVPLQTFLVTIEPVELSHEGVASQTVVLPYFLQAPAPLQSPVLPQVLGSSSPHSPSGSVRSGIGWQFPVGALHRMQSPAHELMQQTPSTHQLLMH
jgi:hypothetical protein